MNNNKSKDGLQDIRNSTFYKEVHEAMLEAWVKELHIDEPMLQLIKERAKYHKLYVYEFFMWVKTVNLMQGYPYDATPTKETIKRVEKEIKAYKRISDRYDDDRYDINNEPHR